MLAFKLLLVMAVCAVLAPLFSPRVFRWLGATLGVQNAEVYRGQAYWSVSAGSIAWALSKNPVFGICTGILVAALYRRRK